MTSDTGGVEEQLASKRAATIRAPAFFTGGMRKYSGKRAMINSIFYWQLFLNKHFLLIPIKVNHPQLPGSQSQL
ncbi:hypothetical protein [Pantoea sp. BAV 3049]|uniref:hypothetical protein n=1 Tax=Pantoea sp. BAV 3049 TaxID=2654188 RepID=UPI001E5C208B|nr:hypothetical protein [Pantoea sp. BAV 3049]